MSVVSSAVHAAAYALICRSSNSLLCKYGSRSGDAARACTCLTCTAYLQVLCVADINRADHQLERGGGAICFVGQAAPGVWQMFDSLVGSDVEQCQDVCPHDNPPNIPKQHSATSDYDDDEARPPKKPVHHRPMKTHKAPTKASSHGHRTKTATAAVSIDRDEI